MPELNTLPVKPDPGPEPELDLLLHNQTLDEPIWKSLFRNIDEFFFPKKLPPLVLTSKPIPVRDIWGFYDNKGKGAIGSTAVHILAVALIIIGTIVAQRAVKEIVKPKETVELIAPSDMPTLEPSKHGFRRWRRWWRSRQASGIAGPVTAAVDGAVHAARGSGTKPTSDSCRWSRRW